jgi:hypothetical protein
LDPDQPKVTAAGSEGSILLVEEDGLASIPDEAAGHGDPNQAAAEYGNVRVTQ